MWKLETGEIWQPEVKKKGHCQRRVSRLYVSVQQKQSQRREQVRPVRAAVSLRKTFPSSITTGAVYCDLFMC